MPSCDANEFRFDVGFITFLATFHAFCTASFFLSQRSLTKSSTQARDKNWVVIRIGIFHGLLTFVCDC